MSAPRFTMDNTQGHSEETLDMLNEIFEQTIRDDPEIAEMPDILRKSHEDYIAESLLARFELGRPL